MQITHADGSSVSVPPALQEVGSATFARRTTGGFAVVPRFLGANFGEAANFASDRARLTRLT